MRKFIVLLWLLLTLAGCASSQNPTVALGDAICASPCWYGLTPGQTTMIQAQNALQALSFIAQPPRMQPDNISWSFAGPVAGYGVLDFKNDVLKQVRLYITGITLGTTIDKFGPPEHVFPTYQPGGDGAQYSLTLYYPAHGIMVETYDKPQGDLKRGKENITRTLAVYEIDLFAPSNLQDFLNDHEFGYGSQERIDYILQYLQSWPGFGEDVVRIKPLN